MGYIYKVTNTINGKIYIGQTSRTIEARWKQHVYCAKIDKEYYVSILHRAMKKYGIENFTVEEVEQCQNSDLDEREIFWINYYDSYHNGYNLDLGGSGSRRCDDEKLMELWNLGYSEKDIFLILNLDRNTISIHLRSMGIPQEEIFKRGAKSASKTKAKPVYYYDINGNYVGEFPSLNDARKAFGGIYISTEAKHKLYGGYKWSRIKADKIDFNSEEYYKKVNAQKIHKTVKKINYVYQYDLNGEYIQSFNDSNEAAKYLNITDSTSIRSACRGEINQTHGYQWRYKKYNKIDPVSKNIILEKWVHQYSIDGKYIQSFENSEKAAKATGASARSIRKVCSGELHQTHGYQWKHEKYDQINSVENKAKSSEPKKVYQYNLSGEYLKSFESVKEAANCFDEKNQSKIRRVCREEVRQAYGYIWRYYKVDKLTIKE